MQWIERQRRYRWHGVRRPLRSVAALYRYGRDNDTSVSLSLFLSFARANQSFKKFYIGFIQCDFFERSRRVVSTSRPRFIHRLLGCWRERAGTRFIERFNGRSPANLNLSRVNQRIALTLVSKEVPKMFISWESFRKIIEFFAIGESSVIIIDHGKGRLEGIGREANPKNLRTAIWNSF